MKSYHKEEYVNSMKSYHNALGDLAKRMPHYCPNHPECEGGKLMREIESFTPGGSEYVGDVAACVAAIKRSREFERGLNQRKAFNSFLNGVEFGVRLSESGKNLQAALDEARKVLDDERRGIQNKGHSAANNSVQKPNANTNQTDNKNS